MNQENVKEMIEQEERTVDIVVPPKEGTILSVVFTFDGDFRSYFPFEYPNGFNHEDAKIDTWGHSIGWYVEKVGEAIAAPNPKVFLKLPQQQHQDWWVYIPVDYLRTKLKHIHLAWTDSPLSKRQMGGEKIAVVRDFQFEPHGPGKRRR